MTMKITNFKTKVGSTLMMLVCCCLLMHNVSAQSPATDFTTNVRITITGTLGDLDESQTRTFVVPENVYHIQIQCWGAGAAGAYMDAPGAFQSPVSGAGGGGGAYARVNDYAVTPGQILTVVIGHGGCGKRDTRGWGGNTYVMDGSTIIVKAAGAPDLADNRRTPGGKGGKHNDCIGDVTFSGGQGGTGHKGAWTCSGAGGGAAGNSANGSNGENGQKSDLWGTIVSAGGAAGPGNPGSGKGGDGKVSHVFGPDGNPGSNYGGGGSGGSSSTVFPAVGGYGGDGIVIISYNACADAVAGSIGESTGCTKSIVNVTAGSGTDFVYTWERSDNGTSGWALVSSSNTANYTPTTSGYYRRGVTACGATVYSNVLQINLEAAAAAVGYVSLADNTDATSYSICKNNDVNIDLKANGYGAEVTRLYWESSNDGGTSWTTLGDQASDRNWNFNQNSLSTGVLVRYFYKVDESCKVYSDNVFTITVLDGALSNTDFTFDNSDINIVLPYGENTATPTISEPDHNYNSDVVVTNNKSTSNAGEILGTVEVGTYTITWTVTDCSGATRNYDQQVKVSYPECGGDFKVADADGNEYETVRIGAECWMKTNLKTSLEGGTPYADDQNLVNEFGLLYTWYAAVGLPENASNSPTVIDGNVVGACPEGWHLPTLEQCQELRTSGNLDPKGGYFNGATSSWGGIGTTLALWCVDSAKPTGHSNFIFTEDDNCETPLGVVSTNPNSKMSIRCIHDAQ